MIIVELERDDPETRLIVCRQCHTHLALFPDFKHLHYFNSPWQIGAVFAKVVNVQIDCPSDHRVSHGQTLADVRCVKCGVYLGLKIVKDERPENPEESEQGCFKMIFDKLNQWNGEEYWELDPDTFNWIDIQTGRSI